MAGESSLYVSLSPIVIATDRASSNCKYSTMNNIIIVTIYISQMRRIITSVMTITSQSTLSGNYTKLIC